MSIWIVDDEINLANGLKKAFEKQGFETRTALNIAELQKLLASEIPTVIFFGSMSA